MTATSIGFRARRAVAPPMVGLDSLFSWSLLLLRGAIVASSAVYVSGWDVGATPGGGSSEVEARRNRLFGVSEIWGALPIRRVCGLPSAKPGDRYVKGGRRLPLSGSHSGVLAARRLGEKPYIPAKTVKETADAR